MNTIKTPTTRHSSINVKDVAIGIKYTPWHSLHSCLLITTFAMPLTLGAYFNDVVYEDNNFEVNIKPHDWSAQNAQGICFTDLVQPLGFMYEGGKKTQAWYCYTRAGANNEVESNRKRGRWKGWDTGDKELRVMQAKDFPGRAKADDLAFMMGIGIDANKQWARYSNKAIWINLQDLASVVTFDNANLSKGGSKEMRIDLAANSTIKNMNFKSFNNNLATINAEGKVDNINVTTGARNARINYNNKGTTQTQNKINKITVSHQGSFNFTSEKPATIQQLEIHSGTSTINTQGGNVVSLTLSAPKANDATTTISASSLAPVTTKITSEVSQITINGGAHNLTLSDISHTIFTQSNGTLNLTKQDATISSYAQSGGTANIDVNSISSYAQSGGTANIDVNSISSYAQSGGTARVRGNINRYTLGASSPTNATASYLNAATANSTAVHPATLENSGHITTMNINGQAALAHVINYSTISTIDAKSGSNIQLTNYGAISTLTAESSTNTSVENSGIINNLTHKGNGIYINMDERFSAIDNITQEGSGNILISSLKNVGRAANPSQNKVDIKGQGGVIVGSLFSGLKGNSAEQVLNVVGNSGNSTTNSSSGTSNTSLGKLRVNEIVIDKLDGNFNPLAKVDTQLQKYATSASANHLDTTNKPYIRFSDELSLLGLSIDQEGNVSVDAGKSLSGTLSSIIITQSMRRKLLSDIYLSEQTRRSLKGSEKENLARERAALLASPAVAKYQKDKAQYDKELQAWHAKANTPENKKLIADYEKAKASYDKQKEAYDKLSNKAKKKAKAPKEPTKPDIIAKAPKEPKEPLNYRSAKEQYEKDLQAWHAKANTPENKKLIADYEKAKANYEKAKADYNKLSANAKKKAKAPQEPKEPAILTQRPDYIPSPQEYQRAKKQYDLDIKEWNKLAHTPANRKIIAAYEKAKKKYDKDLAKYQEWEQSGKNGKAPKAPTKPIEPDILTKKPTLPISPNLDPDVVASLEAGVNDVVGDFFIRAIGSEGSYEIENGFVANSYSVGAMLGGNKLIRIGNGYASLGFYGGYEYTKNGYKDATDFTIDSNVGFAGVRFSHLFAQSKFAGLYYILGADGGYGRANTDYVFSEEMAYRAGVNLYSYGTSLRLGSAIYLNGLKSMLLPSIGAGLEGGMIGAFAMQAYGINGHATHNNPLRFSSNGQMYNLGYGQANLNYYQELGDYFSVTFGGGARYLTNRDVAISAAINGIEATDNILSLHPLYYYGTATLSLYTDGLGDFSAGYTYIQGGTGMTHNASLRYHYFF